MRFYSLWTARFGDLSPVKQLLLMVGIGALLANAMASVFFLLGGYNRLDHTIYLTTIIVIAVGGPLGAFLVARNHTLKRLAHELDTAFRKDGMTGLVTRHEFYLRAEQLIRTNNPLHSAGAFIYADVDHFKSVNDRYGHAIGDDLVQEIGILIRGMLGRRHVGARFGGEEFAVFLADADFGQASWVANRILNDVSTISRKVGDQQVSVTVSIGVSFHTPGQTLEDIVNIADQCLYKAKSQGRNRIVYGPSPQ